MPVTAAARQSPSSPWNPQVYHRASPSISPTALPTGPSSLNYTHPLPFLYKKSPPPDVAPVSSLSPSYFDIVIKDSGHLPDSNPRPHAKKSWDYFSQARPSITNSDHFSLPLNSRPEKLVQPQLAESSNADHDWGSQTTVSFSYGSIWNHEARREAPHDENGFVVFPRVFRFPTSLPTQSRRENHSDFHDPQARNTERQTNQYKKSSGHEKNVDSSSFIGAPETQSPKNQAWPPSCPNLLSLHNPALVSHDISSSSSLLPITENPVLASSLRPPRPAETLPISVDHPHVDFIPAERCEELLQSTPDKVLLLDVRPYPHFLKANIHGSLNLCIPTTLLKRQSFNTQKLEDTFVNKTDKRKFATWKHSTHIIVYDLNARSLRDSGPLINVFKKFTSEGWKGTSLILEGGFTAFADYFPNRIRRQPEAQGMMGVGKQLPSRNLHLRSSAPVAGGCILPDDTQENPFFQNIHRNLDLLTGVGQMVVKLPERLTESKRALLPAWLRLASDPEDKGRAVSELFSKIQKRESERMQEALSSQVTYGTTASGVSSNRFQVAGIEKGLKNRYNDSYPFDHSRVRLQDVPTGGCDYVNANYVKASYTKKDYIATQAPMPDTFADFWRVVWEQDVRVIVALTAEVERGQVKCHPYWNSGDYGPFRLGMLAEKRILINSTGFSQDSPLAGRTGTGHRRAIEPPTTGEVFLSPGSNGIPSETPYIVMRHFTLSHSNFPFQKLREVTQLQYSHWPDYGTTSQPAHLLRLIELCNKASDLARSSHSLANRDEGLETRRPVLVHCSAGCGRTGTFCTVDSVLDMLQRQYMECMARLQANRERNTGQRGGTDGWVHDEVDLIASAVEDFRTQRPRMVQNLSQFVLCYESVLEWVVSQLEGGPFLQHKKAAGEHSASIDNPGLWF